MNKLKEDVVNLLSYAARIFKDVQIDIPQDNKAKITVEKEEVLSVLRFFKDRGFDYLVMISCVDWIEEGEFELVYIISSYLQGKNEYSRAESKGTASQPSPKAEGTGREKTNIILKTRISREDPQFVTSIPVFENAEPYEREIHELFGVNFEGHPRLTRLFLERDYKIPPFRKDFDTKEYVKNVFDKIPFVEDKQ